MCLAEGIFEKPVVILDSIGYLGLKVRIGVHAEPVTSICDESVCTIHPGSPGINMADRLAGELGASDGITRLLDVGDKDVRIDTWVFTIGHPSWRVSV